MKVLMGKGNCTITFDENDGKYNGITVSLYGEGSFVINEFDIYKNYIDEYCWITPLNEKPYNFKTLDEMEKNKLLSYIMEEAKKLGYSIVIW